MTMSPENTPAPAEEGRRSTAPSDSARPLTYCTNIHPGESWADISAAVRRHTPEVKRRVCPDEPFPIGLRLSGEAVSQLSDEEAHRFHDWCLSEDLYVTSVNGFPYGAFHHTPIKEDVYLPDWRSPQRLDYTMRIAELLALWQPESMTGSISTVPVGFRTCIQERDWPLVIAHLSQALDHLAEMAQRTGKEILLCLEPEPGCVLETTGDVVRLFERLPLTPTQRSHLAVCYDCCHQALQFEEPAASLGLLAENDIRIGHVQVSSALRLHGGDIERLRRFQEPCYLHQTVGRHKNGRLVRYDDLGEAIENSPEDIEEWRVHFHVPVFTETTGECDSTRFFLEELLPLIPAGPMLEVETYTWTILPEELQGGSVIDCLAAEIGWVAQTIGSEQ